MQISIIRQTPAVSILLMLLLVAAAFTRVAMAPYGDELIAGEIPNIGAWVDSFQSAYPIWGWILSAVVMIMNGVAIGKLTTALGLYHIRTTVSIPLYAIISCGIFIASDSLVVALATYFTVQMFRYLCGGYVRGTDFNYAFYAGLCAGLAPLLYAPTTLLVILLPIAILMFGFSWREVVVMTIGLIFPLGATSYIDWLMGGEFSATAIGLLNALVYPCDYTPWASESVVALTMMGLAAFATICSIAAFVGEKRSVSVRPRTIITFCIILLIVAGSLFLLPSATAGLFAIVAIPISILIPIFLMRLSDDASSLVILALILLVILHCFIP